MSKPKHGRIFSVSIFAAYIGSRNAKNHPFTFIRHLAGVKSMLDRLVNSISEGEEELSQAARVAFWTSARRDILHSLSNHTPTNIDTENVSYWNFFGAKIGNAKSVGCTILP
jgi:hypothetical protein